MSDQTGSVEITAFSKHKDSLSLVLSSSSPLIPSISSFKRSWMAANMLFPELLVYKPYICSLGLSRNPPFIFSKSTSVVAVLESFSMSACNLIIRRTGRKMKRMLTISSCNDRGRSLSLLTSLRLSTSFCELLCFLGKHSIFLIQILLKFCKERERERENTS